MAASFSPAALIAKSVCSKFLPKLSNLPIISPKPKLLPSLSITTQTTDGLKAGARSALSIVCAARSSYPPPRELHSQIQGPSYVVRDNVDIHRLFITGCSTLASSDSGYPKVSSDAVTVHPPPSPAPTIPFLDPVLKKTNFPILIARSCSPLALATAEMEASGVAVVVAESFSPVFLRELVVRRSTVLPLVSDSKVSEECSTGDIVCFDRSKSALINRTTGKEYSVKAVAGDGGGATSLSPSCGIYSRSRIKIPPLWAHLFTAFTLYAALCLCLLAAPKDAHRPIIINNNIINEQRELLPNASMVNKSLLGISVFCNNKQNSDNK